MNELPLAGVTVAVTRPAHQAERLASALRAVGAEVAVVPLIEVVSDADGIATLGEALADPLKPPHAVVVTSPNGARCLAEVWHRRAGDGPAVVVVGPGTAEALVTAGGPPATLVAEDHVAEGVAAAMGQGGGHVVVAQGDLARPVLVQTLRDQGWDVTSVTVYRTVARTPSPEECHLLLGADLITLASGSAARSWAAVLVDHDRGPDVVVMGPVTQQVAMDRHLPVVGAAHPHTLDGLVEATVRAVLQRRPGGSTPGS